MEGTTHPLKKLFSGFGGAHHDLDLLHPKTPKPRSHIFSLLKYKSSRQKQLAWKPHDVYGKDIKEMNHGAEARTSLTQSITTGRVYIVKRFTDYIVPPEDTSQRGEQPLPNEATVLLKVLESHPNILRAFGCDLFGGKISNLYTEYLNGGNLQEQMYHYIRVDRTPPEAFVLHAFISIADALAYCHNGLRSWDSTAKRYLQEPGLTTSYIHGDVKLENVFLSWTDEAKHRGLPTVILGDFGAAQPADRYRGIAGTPGYQAPELAEIYNLRDTNRREYIKAMKTTGYMNPAADVYSLGQSIHKLCTGRAHVTGADPESFPVRKTEDGMIGVRLGHRRGYDTQALEETVKWCLRHDPLMRPKTEEGSLLISIAIFRDALEALEKTDRIARNMWATPW